MFKEFSQKPGRLWETPSIPYNVSVRNWDGFGRPLKMCVCANRSEILKLCFWSFRGRQKVDRNCKNGREFPRHIYKKM